MENARHYRTPGLPDSWGATEGFDLPRPSFQPKVNVDEVYVPFTQYLRPNGVARDVGVTMPDQYKSKIDAITEAGALFEIEVLTTGDVSMTVEWKTPIDEYETIAHELSPNSPEIDAALVRLVENAYKRISEY